MRCGRARLAGVCVAAFVVAQAAFSAIVCWSAVTSSGLVGRLLYTVILMLRHILMDERVFPRGQPTSLRNSSEQTRNALMTWLSWAAGRFLRANGFAGLRRDLRRDQVPYFFTPNGGGAQWASTSAELLASLAALKAFGWLDEGRARHTVPIYLVAGRDNMANVLFSSKRSTTKWPLMLINMELSSCLERAKLSLDLR